MDCCNYVEYRHHQGYPYHHQGNYQQCYQPPYYPQQPLYDFPEQHAYHHQDYVYNPKEARLRKALREQSRESRSHLGRTAQAPSMAAQRGQQWPKNSLQQRHPKLQEDFRKSIRDQVDHGLLHGYPDGSSIDVDNIAFHPMGQMTLPGAGEYAILPDIDNQSWYPYSQGGQQNYMMRQPDVKMQGNPWNTYSDNRVYQGNPFAMRQQVLGGNSGFGSAVGQQTHNPAIIQRNTTMQPQQFPNMYPGSVSAAAMQVKNEREENLRMMNMIPVNSSSQSNQKIAATSGSFTTSDVSQESKNTSKKGGKCSNAPSVPVTTSTAITNSEANSSNTTESPPKPEPLPAFNESFVATEIGRISQEGFRKQQHNLSQVNQDQQVSYGAESLHYGGSSPPTNFEQSYASINNYSYFNYMQDYQQSYNLAPMNWASGYKCDDILNGY